MDAASDIQWMRREKFDGEEQEAAGEEDTCEGESQSKARSEEGSQETCRKESYEEQEAAGEEDTCESEGESQSKARSKEGSQEISCEESCAERFEETCCSGTQGGSDETSGEDSFSRFVQTSGPSPRQKVREAVCGRGAPAVLAIAADGVADAERS